MRNLTFEQNTLGKKKESLGQSLAVSPNEGRNKTINEHTNKNSTKARTSFPDTSPHSTLDQEAHKNLI